MDLGKRLLIFLTVTCVSLASILSGCSKKEEATAEIKPGTKTELGYIKFTHNDTGYVDTGIDGNLNYVTYENENGQIVTEGGESALKKHEPGFRNARYLYTRLRD